MAVFVVVHADKIAHPAACGVKICTATLGLQNFYINQDTRKTK
jgi:hypothetical protein